MVFVALFVAASTGCSGSDNTSGGAQDLAIAGPWAPSTESLAIGDPQYVKYTGAGPWVGTSGCGGSFLPGTQLMKEWIYGNFPQVWYIGGYACRAINGNPNVMSVHATGRALDLHVYTVDGDEADNELGDPLANYLIEHQEELGIQYIIWDRWKYNSSKSAGTKDGSYGGAHPHNDHLHIELSVAAAGKDVPWYTGPMNPPDLAPCGTIPAEGGIVDDADRCAQAYGPSEYWRVVEGQGYAGRMMWTNAFESTDPSNWARYNTNMEAAGLYELEYYSTAEFAVYNAVDYQIHHDGQVTELSVDQGGLDGWISLGQFQFAEGAGQSVRVLDTAGAVGADQSIVYDAIRLTPVSDGGGDGSGSGEGGGGGVDVDGSGGGGGGGADVDEVDGISGGCSASGGGAGGTAGGLIPVLLMGVLRRRRRRR